MAPNQRAADKRMIGFWLGRDELKALDEIAKSNKLNRAELIRKYIREEMDREAKRGRNP